MKSFAEYGLSSYSSSYQHTIQSQNQQLQQQLQYQQQLQQLQQQRMVQQHQQQFFEEPEVPMLMAVRIMDGLFVGNAMAGQDDDFLFSNKVTHVVNCAGLEAANIFVDHGIEYITFPWRDIATTQILDAQDRNIARITKFIEKAFEKGECILIHSLNGISRSCVVVAGYLIYKFGWTLEQSLSFMHIAHPDMRIQTYFIRQLKLLAKRKSKVSESFDPRDYSVKEQQMLLKNTYLNCLPFNEAIHGQVALSKVQHKRKVIFNESEITLVPRNNVVVDLRSKPNKGVLKIPDGFTPLSVVPDQPSDRTKGRGYSDDSSANAPEEPMSSRSETKGVDPRIKAPIEAAHESPDGSPPMKILTGPDIVSHKTASTLREDTEFNGPILASSSSFEYSKLMNHHGTNGFSQSITDSLTNLEQSTGQKSDENENTLNIRKRPTTFNSVQASQQKPEAVSTIATPAAVKSHVSTQPKKFRGPTPPKRPTSAAPSSNSSTTSSIIRKEQPSLSVYPQVKQSLTTIGSSQQSYQQDQEPLFMKVNRKPASPTGSDSTRNIRSSVTSSFSAQNGISGSSLKRAPNTNTSSATIDSRKRPSSAPRTRALSLTSNNEQPSPLTPQNSIPSLQSMYSSQNNNNRPMSAPTSNSLGKESPRKKKKKKKPIKVTRKEADSRLMRPTLSFLRKTVTTGKK